ncbi:retrovirus-related pol polyprotein from transposon TNT 1-94 [Tanacetum coccineum]|uniref:Retrovirus-related pol polyprotein from transposon TNT 1-94 n=1 Tax=Tanacetum coccineum TaxID=301880 RepID=A0ABQ4WKB2_9ASTR
MHDDDTKPNYVVDSHADYTSNSNMIPYDQYVKDNAVPVVQSNVSSVTNDAYMIIYNDCDKLTVKKKERKLKKNFHSVKLQLASTINHNKSMVEEVTSLKKDFKQKENKYLEEFLDMKALKEKTSSDERHKLSKERHCLKGPTKALTVYPPNTPATLVPRVLPTKSQVKINIFALIQLFSDFEKTCNKRITPTGLTEGERGFEQTKACYLTEVIPFFKTLKEHFEGIQKALTKEVKEMKEIFEELEAEVDQHVVDRKHDEIERKNLLIANDNLIADCLFKDVFHVATNSELNVSSFTEMHDAHTSLKARCLELEVELSDLRDKIQRINPDDLLNGVPILRTLDFQITQLTEKINVLQEQNELFRAENGKIKQHYKELYDSIKITRAKHLEQTTALLTENESLKVQIQNKLSCVNKDHVKPKVLAPGKYAIDVEPIPPRNRNNREVHLVYLKHLKESVETLREIVEEAKVERPLDSSLASACRYTKHSQELLEYVIGTCPKALNTRDNKHASTSLPKKKQVTFEEQCAMSKSNTHKPIEQLNCQKTNVPVPPSTGVNSCTDASRSQPRSNTKKNRILPAKSVNMKKVEEHPRTIKSSLKTTNRVDSSISSKRTVVHIILWYLDLGCSKYMIGDRSRLKNFVKKFIGTVRFGNDHFGAIMGYGDYVIGENLEVAFRKHSFYVRDTDGVELIKGSRGSNLYTFSIEEMLKSSPICLLSKASKNKSWLWHRRLNHLNFSTINDLARKDLVRGLPRLKFEKDHLCSACQLGKSKKHTHKPKTKNTNLEVLNTLHMDLCGPMRVQTINGKKYILVIVDDYSRFTWVKFLISKDETPEVVIKFLKQIQVGLNKTVRNIRIDNGTGFFNKDLTDYYERVSIFHQKTIPRTPQQNNVLKRRNRTLVEAARTMLIFSKAPMFLWAEAVATVCYTQNRSLIHTRHCKTPYELVHEKKPNLTFFRVFGALCYPTNDSKDLGKLQPTADIGIFVGYVPSRKGYGIYNKRTRRIMETIHVQFDELTEQMAPVQLSTGPTPTFLMPGQISSEPPRIERPVSPAPAVQVPVNSTGTPSSTTIDQDAPSPSHSLSSSALQSPSLHQGVTVESPLMEDNPFAPIDNDHFINVFALEPSKDHPLDNIIGNPSRPVSTRKQLATDALWCLYNSVLSKVEPKNFKSAITKDCWFQAMQDEIHEFDRLQVWELVPPPDCVMFIALKWIYKVKFDEYGDVLKNKARLVAKGYRQKEGIEFHAHIGNRPTYPIDLFRLAHFNIFRLRKQTAD